MDALSAPCQAMDHAGQLGWALQAGGYRGADRRECATVPPSSGMIYEGSLAGSRAPVAWGEVIAVDDEARETAGLDVLDRQGVITACPQYSQLLG